MVLYLEMLISGCYGYPSICLDNQAFPEQVVVVMYYLYNFSNLYSLRITTITHRTKVSSSTNSFQRLNNLFKSYLHWYCKYIFEKMFLIIINYNMLNNIIYTIYFMDLCINIYIQYMLKT